MSSVTKLKSMYLLPTLGCPLYPAAASPEGQELTGTWQSVLGGYMSTVTDRQSTILKHLGLLLVTRFYICLVLSKYAI